MYLLLLLPVTTVTYVLLLLLAVTTSTTCYYFCYLLLRYYCYLLLLLLPVNQLHVSDRPAPSLSRRMVDDQQRPGLHQLLELLLTHWPEHLPWPSAVTEEGEEEE